MLLYFVDLAKLELYFPDFLLAWLWVKAHYKRNVHAIWKAELKQQAVCFGGPGRAPGAAAAHAFGTDLPLTLLAGVGRQRAFRSSSTRRISFFSLLNQMYVHLCGEGTVSLEIEEMKNICGFSFPVTSGLSSWVPIFCLSPCFLSSFSDCWPC